MVYASDEDREGEAISWHLNEGKTRYERKQKTYFMKSRKTAIPKATRIP
jgi:DNA topoisomerase IA